MKLNKGEARLLNYAIAITPPKPACHGCLFFKGTDQGNGLCHYDKDYIPLETEGTPVDAHHLCPHFVSERLRPLIAQILSTSDTVQLEDEQKSIIDLEIEEALSKERHIAFFQICREIAARHDYPNSQVRAHIQYRIDREELASFKQDVGASTPRLFICKPDQSPTEEDRSAIYQNLKTSWKCPQRDPSNDQNDDTIVDIVRDFGGKCPKTNLRDYVANKLIVSKRDASAAIEQAVLRKRLTCTVYRHRNGKIKRTDIAIA